ncbi:PREDICTED: non-muscle caldesmon-like [Cyprinodon variegatus]|uniref:Non-muscle caldesmon-like n=1 Tax=Cyprinodon variegatus TaxID=28743 RepID=A0A3Q2EEK0_CYPVA|nr:PREDICTED: non-muscle caldesmon-like [Cyprinodon variegatus]
MSNALLRRNSSKQGLQNLIRLTAQRSIEDAEEVERERRRKARESLRRRNSGSTPEDSSPENEAPEERNIYELKPSGFPSLEEDEGFSDWTQRKEKQRLQHLQELSLNGKEEEADENVFIKNNVVKKPPEPSVPYNRFQRREQEESDIIRAKVESKKEQEEEARRRKEKEVFPRTVKEIQRPNTEAVEKKEARVSYTSKVFLCQEPKHRSPRSVTTSKEVTSSENQMNRSSRKTAESEEAKPFLEAEQRLEKIRQSLQEKESQELEQIRHRQIEAEQELEELKKRREERRRARAEEERKREEEERQQLALEEEERRKMKEDMDKRRMEAAERMKTLSTSSTDGEEVFSPITPKVSTPKIAERTNSLNRSLKKSNSFKKTQPLLLLTKIDDKLEQYTHAVENSLESRATKSSLTDLPSSPEVVATKKNLYEAGEAWNTKKGVPSKDTGSLKVGVANLITHWVKGPSETSSKQPSFRPADVKSGDVLQKKHLWEVLGDPSRKTEQKPKATADGTKSKFVITGHGKYEKISVD